MSKRDTINIRSHRSLHNTNDAGQFMQNLLNQQPNNIIYALRLLLLIPSMPAELLNAQWGDIDFNQWHWVIKRPRQNPNTGRWSLPCIAELSGMAIQCLSALHQLNGHQEYLFPDLVQLKKADRDKQIAQAIQVIWGYYMVDANSFQEFIGAMAREHGYFESTFIDQAVANKCKAEPRFSSFNFHKRALAEWWGNELMMKASNSIVTQFNCNV
ncbi:MAG: hypothetical protein WC426_09475 [Sulfuriferula sp.]